MSVKRVDRSEVRVGDGDKKDGRKRKREER